MQLQKVVMMWKDCRNLKEIEPQLLQDDRETFVRVNQFNDSLITVEISNISSNQISAKFAHFHRVLRGKCHTIKFHIEAEKPGKLPYSRLKELGFKKSDSFIWRLKHSDYSVGAIAIPHIREPYWVLQISKHTGSGLPATAYDMASLLQTQIELELPVNVS